MLYNVQKEFLQKSNFKCWFKSILDMAHIIWGPDPKKFWNISVVVTNDLQMVWSNTKNRNVNETVILEMYAVLCEKYTVSSFMHLLVQYMYTSTLKVRKIH